MSQYSNDNTWLILMTSKLSRNLSIFCNFETKAKYSSSNMFLHLHSFYWICLIGINMAFNVRESTHIFKLCYLTAKVVIFIFVNF